jgi:hypothetical protein
MSWIRNTVNSKRKHILYSNIVSSLFNIASSAAPQIPEDAGIRTQNRSDFGMVSQTL